MSIDWQALEDAAREAREHSHSPYSGFRVGAALLTADGTIVAGCNVENRSYGLSICAERTAVVKAVAAGLLDTGRPLRAVLVITELSPPATPCGMCRETLREFGRDDLPIRCTDLEGGHLDTTLVTLHPAPFAWEGPESRGPAP